MRRSTRKKKGMRPWNLINYPIFKVTFFLKFTVPNFG